MAIELMLLKGMFIAAAVGFAVQQIVSVNRELRRDRETAAADHAGAAETPQQFDEGLDEAA